MEVPVPDIKIQEIISKYTPGDGSTSIQYVLQTPKCLPKTTTSIISGSGTVSRSSSSFSTSTNSSTVSSSSGSSLNFSACKPPQHRARITPRVFKKTISTLGMLNTSCDKMVQVNSLGNDENIPPGGSNYQLESENINLRKQMEILRAQNDKMKSENAYCIKQVQRMQAESSASTEHNEVTETFGNNIQINGVHYDVDRNAIGKGASCVVYRGFDKAQNQMVAIKVVSLRKLSPLDKQEIKREVELLENLNNEAYIINLLNYEYQSQKGRILLVLEYGETDLNTYLQKTPCLRDSKTKLSYHQVCLLWQQMLQAVKCIHAHNIVHKDLKPQNFLMVKGKLKLIDFGISEIISSDVTSMVILRPEGTPNYIAPEMLSGTFGTAKDNILSYRSDVFSLGCILYKMCWGVAPYQHINNMQMKYSAISSTDPIPIPDDLQFPDIRNILARCLDKNRQTRPTIDDLLEM